MQQKSILQFGMAVHLGLTEASEAAVGVPVILDTTLAPLRMQDGCDAFVWGYGTW